MGDGRWIEDMDRLQEADNAVQVSQDHMASGGQLEGTSHPIWDSQTSRPPPAVARIRITPH